ncbi:DUF4112 domain-containing protein [Sphingomonas quercus]|uniref:DUF4112 domain-containing protein n=1 Tax=Sphingomonas quercus TaxID=2842451 RepID=A0ABS6BKY5_9SPHN|nr:DUF4112 domain-containing protein [Sphingomonas quercus]MBU3078961.1 DUF4112 domain-containing protein [Sphingomonas quercus]
MPRPDPLTVRRRVERMELMLERSMTLPIINRPIGLDAVMGLVPVVGDVMGAMLGAYLIWEARNLGMSKWQMTRMAANIGIDTLLGAIPVVGDIFDFAWRSNSRNLRIVRRHLDRHHPGQAIVTLDRAGS